MSTNNKVPSDADAPPLVQWGEALRQHPDLTADIQQAHAALQSDYTQGAALRAHAVAAWQAIPPDARVPFESALLFVHMPADEALQALAVIMPAAPTEALRAFLDAARVWTQHGERRHAAIREWLSRRYRNTWAAAPHLGDYWLHHILDVVIGAGTWESAMVPILALARMGDEKRGTRALADVFADAEALAPPWAPRAAAMWSEHYLERPGESGCGGRRPVLSRAIPPWWCTSIPVPLEPTPRRRSSAPGPALNR